MRQLPVCDQLISVSIITSSSSVSQCVDFASEVTQCPISVCPTLLVSCFGFCNTHTHLQFFILYYDLLFFRLIFFYMSKTSQNRTKFPILHALQQPVWFPMNIHCLSSSKGSWREKPLSLEDICHLKCYWWLRTLDKTISRLRHHQSALKAAHKSSFLAETS